MWDGIIWLMKQVSKNKWWHLLNDVYLFFRQWKQYMKMMFCFINRYLRGNLWLWESGGSTVKAPAYWSEALGVKPHHQVATVGLLIKALNSLSSWGTDWWLTMHSGPNFLTAAIWQWGNVDMTVKDYCFWTMCKVIFFNELLAIGILLARQGNW